MKNYKYRVDIIVDMKRENKENKENGEKSTKTIDMFNKYPSKKIIKNEETCDYNKIYENNENNEILDIIEDDIDKTTENINIDKSIILNNKRVRDTLINKGKSIRNETKDLDDIYLTYEKQIQILNEYYLNEVNLNEVNLNKNNNCEKYKLLRSELIKKVNSYKNQDLSKNLYNSNTIISLNEVVEKLVSSKLKCHYCLKSVLLFYKNVRDEFQWTLDRVDNDMDHSNDNTIIACLKCNLQRRRRDKDIFLFSKQLKINKI